MRSRGCSSSLDCAPSSPTPTAAATRVAVQIEAHVARFAQKQRDQLAKQTKPRLITVCKDETFHPEPCLGAIEPVSNFIVLETYAAGRDATTWNDALEKALNGLPVRVIQSTSDEGKGLLSHVRSGLGAHHSPDTFHTSQELTRATSATLSSAVRRAEEAVAEATALTEKCQREAKEWAHTKHGPGRQARIDKAAAHTVTVGQALDEARIRQEEAHQAVRDIGAAYHPVDLSTGALYTAVQVAAVVETHFDAITVVAAEADLLERCLKGIRKAHRLLPALAYTLTFVLRQTRELVESLDISAQEARAVEDLMVPVAYLDRAARKAGSADERATLRELADNLSLDSAPLLAQLGPERSTAIQAVVQECADLFQRSSSCVEGRN